MKIALLGYGKMGKAIDKIAGERGHEVIIKADSENIASLQNSALSKADVAIEFSRPESAIENIHRCIKAEVPIVVGTTGWYEQYGEIVDAIEKADQAILTATNFSVGVNLFFALNQRLAELMNPQEDYSAEITEIHHLQKLDSPSGTAISLAEDLIQHHHKYKDWVNESSQAEGTLGIVSKREAEVHGTHIIKYSSEIDEIEISHIAKSRSGFALGAVIASEFLADKKGVYKMSDVLKL